MHAKRFSSVRHSTQGFAGDASSLGFRADAFDEEDSVFFISCILFVDASALVSIVFDSVDDAVVTSMSFLSNESVDDNLEAACSRARASIILFVKCSHSFYFF
jgi:hypothetical protein